MEEHYLKAACFLCAEMYEKGCVAVTINKQSTIVKVEDVLIYLAEKIKAVQKDDLPKAESEEENT